MVAPRYINHQITCKSLPKNSPEQCFFFKPSLRVKWNGKGLSYQLWSFSVILPVKRKNADLRPYNPIKKSTSAKKRHTSFWGTWARLGRLYRLLSAGECLWGHGHDFPSVSEGFRALARPLMTAAAPETSRVAWATRPDRLPNTGFPGFALWAGAGRDPAP